MKKGFLIVSTCILMLNFISQPSHLQAADPFYTKIFSDGKVLFSRGDYQEALKNFQVAEFGLYEDKETLKEIYIYYALTQFKLNRPDQAREILGLLKTELGVTDLAALTPPEALKIDFTAMTGVLADKGLNGKGSLKAAFDFEVIFMESRQNLKANRLEALPGNISRLEAIDKHDGRIPYLEGIHDFKTNKYRDSVKYLKRAAKTLTRQELLDDINYYLVLCHYALKQKTEALAAFEKIKDQTLRFRLSRITEQLKNTADKDKQVP